MGAGYTISILSVFSPKDLFVQKAEHNNGKSSLLLSSTQSGEERRDGEGRGRERDCN